jgi:F0F1-type ATP synthase membrane subunit b/b'
VIVPKDTLYNLLDELRLRTPDEIKRYQKIIANRDAIINDAETKAQTIIAQAEEKAKNLVSEHEIMQQAYLQANEVVSAANDEAIKLRDTAKKETEDLMRVTTDAANEMTTTAKHNSDEMIRQAVTYTNELLTMIDDVVSTTLNESKNNYEKMYSTLSSSLSVVRENRQQLVEGHTKSKEGKKTSSKKR